ncbi:MAG: methionyl-tRNA formyltransferase [Prolixibacteraceae bacterium]
MKGTDVRIVFMGTPDFAVASLRALVEGGYQVVGVITAPDKPAGRGQVMHQTAVKVYAQSQGLKVLQPEKLKDVEFIEALRSLKADLQVVVAFRMLPVVVWDMPALGTFNLHASLLPKYRGAAPLNWALINGETESGVTTFKLQHEIDTGNIIFQERVAIGPNDNVEVLHDRLMEIGSGLVLKTVEALAEGNVKFVSQDELIAKGDLPCPAPKIFKNDCLIHWENSALSIHNFVRGLSPYPAAWMKLIAEDDQTELTAKIYQVAPEEGKVEVAPGTIQSDLKTFVKIAVKDGFISIKEIQLAGKKRMKVDEFLRGFQQIVKYKAIV